MKVLKSNVKESGFNSIGNEELVSGDITDDEG